MLRYRCTARLWDAQSDWFTDLDTLSMHGVHPAEHISVRALVTQGGRTRLLYESSAAVHLLGSERVWVDPSRLLPFRRRRRRDLRRGRRNGLHARERL